jgi:hypothetical protein
MIKHARLTVMVLGLLFAAGRADATTLTFDFTGTVLSNDFNPFGITDLSGTPVTGSFSYDTGTADSDADPTRGTYCNGTSCSPSRLHPALPSRTTVSSSWSPSTTSRVWGTRFR